jgi:hypothetical protein
MSNGRKFDQPGVYQVRIVGTLDERWYDWFEGLTITPQTDNETLLTGTVVDQIALHGLLSRIRDLGLCLLSVQRLETGEDTRGTSDLGQAETPARRRDDDETRAISSKGETI